MTTEPVDIDDLIPHRRPMRLIDEILEIGADQASTAATVADDWPLIENGAASPIVLIELAAQTAGICIGKREKQSADGNPEGMGWLVGVKSAEFRVTALPLGTCVVTRTINRFHYDLFTEIEATAHIGDEPAGVIVLQVMQSDTA